MTIAVDRDVKQQTKPKKSPNVLILGQFHSSRRDNTDAWTVFCDGSHVTENICLLRQLHKSQYYRNLLSWKQTL